MTRDTAVHILLSESTDPYFNLALEEWLLRDSHHSFVVLIYRNRPSIILGRNQNPWLECDLDFSATNDITVARRISGGGAVYHDPGNTNFTFIMPRPLYEPTKYLGYASRALIPFGIRARITKRHNLFVGQAKVSGTAFMLTGKRALQHGTLLIDADLGHIGNALTPANPKVETHAVASVPSPVRNLTEIAPSLTHDNFAKSLIAVLAEEFETTYENISADNFDDAPRLHAYLDKQHDWEWIYGRTPAFNFEIPDSHSNGQPIRLTVRKGRIFEVEAPDDSPAAQELRKHIGSKYSPGYLRRNCLLRTLSTRAVEYGAHPVGTDSRPTGADDVP